MIDDDLDDELDDDLDVADEDDDLEPMTVDDLEDWLFPTFRIRRDQLGWLVDPDPEVVNN